IGGPAVAKISQRCKTPVTGHAAPTAASAQISTRPYFRVIVPPMGCLARPCIKLITIAHGQQLDRGVGTPSESKQAHGYSEKTVSDVRGTKVSANRGEAR